MNKIEKASQRLDGLQQGHRGLGFCLAVIKKYSDDQAGYKAALLTYYTFLSLFPLLLLLTTLTDGLVGSNSPLGHTIINSLTGYFPLLGNQLSSHVHGLHSNGLALAAGILFTLYGTRGVADAFRHGVQEVWLIPKSQQDGFPKSLLKSFAVVVIGGLGFIAAAIISDVTASGHGALLRAVAVFINLFMLFWLFEFLLNFSLPRHVTVKQIRAGAATAAVGLVLLQTIGTFILRHELKSLDALYSTFAIGLGLLFWIYLQAQLLYYAVEIAVVSNYKLYPRSLSGPNKTAADTRLSELKSRT